jgi:glycogen synthase
LNINLITKLDLKGVPVIANFVTNLVPTTIENDAIPYLDYNIDPSGNLFGNTICGVNNFVHYMVYNPNTNL